MSNKIIGDNARGYYVDSWGYLRDRNGIQRDGYWDDGHNWCQWGKSKAKGKWNSTKGKGHGYRSRNSKGSDVGLIEPVGMIGHCKAL
jgi:hypothetical protein